MAATNFILAVYQKLYALADAHAPTAAALKAGNKVREDAGMLNPRGTRAKAPADFPRVILRCKGIAGTIEDPTFSRLEIDAEVDGAWIETVTVNYEAKVIHDGLQIDKNSLFELEFLTALRKGGPKLKIDYVSSWTYRSTNVETDKDDDAPGAMRSVTTFTIPVTMQFEGSELLT